MNDTFKNDFLIFQYNINNNKTRIIISLWDNKEMQKYNILTI